MATPQPIPQADKALLAAQAQAGKAGIDAYNAAKSELEAQRQAAVQRALREATLRGTPLDAVQSQLSTVTQPYDQQIAALTAGRASFAADMAAREQRATDYNEAIASARTLIPFQVQQQIAPIMARNQFELDRIRQQSQGRLFELDAQRRLMEARAEAEYQAYLARKREQEEEERRRREAESSLDPNQSELRSLLVEGARGRLGDLFDRATRTARQRASLAAAHGPNRATFEQAEQRAAQERARVFREQMSKVGAAASLFGVDPAIVLNPQRATPAQAVPSSLVARGGESAPTKLYAGDRAGDVMRQTRGRTGPSLVQQAINRELARVSERLNRERARTVQRQQRAAQRPPFETGFISPDELDALGVYGEILRGAGEQLTPASLARLIGGQVDPRTGRQSPIASDLFRQAMLDVAQDLIDAGYDIDMAEVLEAIGVDEVYSPGATLFDVENRMTGGRRLRDEFAAEQDRAESERRRAQQEARQQQREMEELDREQARLLEQEAKDNFFRRWGVPYTPSMGPLADVIAATESPEFDQAIQQVEAEMGGRMPSSRRDIDEILDNAGITDPLTRRLIRAIYLG